MIPGIMVDFLDRASVAVASTRTGKLLPHIHFLSGWYLEENREVLVCLVAEGFTEALIESLEDNGRLAMTAEVIGPHETYQFKGRYLDSRPTTEADLAVHAACRQRFFQAITRSYTNLYSDASILSRIGPPAVAVRMRVEEIYVQTPGPAAGRRLVPQESA